MGAFVRKYPIFFIFSYPSAIYPPHKFAKTKKLPIFAPAKRDSHCGCGVIGSRARLRIWCREACRFESYHPHSS